MICNQVMIFIRNYYRPDNALLGSIQFRAFARGLFLRAAASILRLSDLFKQLGKCSATTLLIFFLLAGCSSQNTSDEIVIGGYGALTGTTATFGQSTQKGIEMAFHEVNQKGGLLGKKFRLVMEDDQGKPEEAQTVVSRLINRNRVVAVIGENASSRSLAAAPVCQQAKIPMVSPSSTNPKVTEVGDFIFRVCFIDPFQGKVMAKFAAETLKVKQVAILRDIKNDYSVGLAEVFTQSFEQSGGKIIANESYSEGDSDFSAQLTSLKQHNPEAIFIPGYYTEVGLIARQARKLGITVPLLGGDGWESPKLWEIGGEALNDCYYSNHYSLDDPSPTVQKFVQAYKARYQEVPDAVAALSYDAAGILFHAIAKANSAEPQKIRDALATIRNYSGVTGQITIDEKRNALKPAVVLKVKDGKLEFVQSIQP
ncbi:ABC transporter substrate-binding protein [bacterium]|nr:ABC transporter substrate-binding protein [bacterium]